VTTEQIRPIAIGIFRRDDRILVFESRERDSRGRIFYRPLGGSIEFGEYGDQALTRELREELGAEIENVVSTRTYFAPPPASERMRSC
jgi:NADH pyrophosphatase NudC (nudix superfamily)